MKVAGIGYRDGTGLGALKDVLARSQAMPDALAISSHKGDIDAVTLLAKQLGLPVIRVAKQDLHGIQTLTQSPRQLDQFGTGSLAEATALVAAGPDSRLIGPRVVSSCRSATLAIAEGPDI